jgi:two-component system, NarL family, nitrate/nitrite response regulator NarL
MKPISLILIDDHQIVLDGLKLMFENDSDFKLINTYTNPEQALKFIGNNPVDIVVTDYSLPGMNGLELIDKIKNQNREIKCVLLSMHDEPAIVRQAMKANINGFLIKNISKTELKEALRKIQAGVIYISPEITTRFLQLQRKATDVSLTEREQDVLELIIKELPNKAIADRLKISERTVETHRKNIFVKTQTNNLVGLMKYVFENNLLK